MSRWNLRKRQRNLSYYEPEDPPLDEYVYCDHCADIVYEYCAIHGPLLVVPDDKVPVNIDLPSIVPRAALTIPHFFLHLAPSVIPGAGLGVFSSLTLPSGVRFGPYCGKKVDVAQSDYCWQIYDKDHKPSHLVEAEDANRSNWMRYVNCARHWCEQNLVAYQYQGQIYYRTIRIIPKFTELLVFYGSEFANYLHIDLRLFNSPLGQEKLYNVFIKNPIPKITEIKVDTNIQTKPIEEPINEQCDKSTEANTITKTENTEKNKNNNDLDKINPNNGYEKNKNDIKVGKGKRLKIHTGEKPYQCDICKYKCTVLGHLKIHLRTHTGEKPYQCDICKYKCTQLGSLKKHLRTHTGEKPYQCDICKYKCTQLGHLKKHLRTHTGEKPYQCDICKYKCTQLDSLKIHLRTHTGEKPYQCDKCKYKCTQLGSLKTHLRIHTGEKPYQCDICKHKFTVLCSLKKHLRIHTGEKPYQCDKCKYKCTQFGSLKTHLRTHTGEKPYQCDICKCKFTHSNSFKNHLNKHLS